MGILLNDVWHTAVVDFGCVSSRILWNSSFPRLKFVWWLGTAPMKQRVKKDNEVRQACIMSPWLFHVYMDGGMKDVNMGMGRTGVSFMEEGREWR